jgi:hypothetical protein
MATLPAGGTPGGITHDFIVSGRGTMFTDGYIVNGRHNDQPIREDQKEPTCGGMAYDVPKARTVEVASRAAITNRRCGRRIRSCRTWEPE